ncbi:exosortase A [Pelomonas saccharophila]|uniref:Exosortase A n=1 Tax=Roseateles saccharophilus TaxID=304 RepID=A0ABU1YQN0_ROSSA|nr:exosortase A [Roseateles saccharophilus]MDR7271165.1 exosortase A [Roseateles saccharophilus]
MIRLPKPWPKSWNMPLLGLALAWGLLAVLYFATGAAMVEIWNRSETFAHAWVVPPISAWLVWRRRAELASITPKPAPLWLLALLPLGLLWLLGDLAAANAATQFALLGMGVVLVPALLGNEAAGRITFPLGFLFFAVPFGDFLTPWLVDRTADFTVIALRATGIPVFREGTQFVIPTGSWSVVQACSGIRYLMASVMVGTLFAYLNYRSYKKRWVFVGVAILTPLVANWLRAYMIVMLGHLSGNKLAVGVDHIIYGWVFFGIIMLAMFMIGARWSDPDPEPVLAAPGEASTTASRNRFVAVLVAAMLVVALPTGLRAQVEHAGAHGQPSLAAPSLPGMNWVAEPLSSWEPHFKNAAGTLHGRFEPTAGGPAVGVFIGYYRDQRYGRQLITSVNDMVNIEEEKEWSRTSRGLDAVDGQSWRTGELRGQALDQVSGGGNQAPRLRVWQTYWINGRPFVSDWQAKLYGAAQKLLGQGDDAAVILVYADKASVGADDARLREFVKQNWAALDTALRGVRDRDAARQQ